MSWEKIELGIAAPAKPLKKSITGISGEVWALNLDMVEPVTGKIIQKVFSPISEIGTSTHRFDERHVLYSKLRPYLNKVVLPDEEGIATSELLPLCPDPEILDRKFLAYYLRSESFVAWANEQVAGAKMPRVSTKLLWKHKVPIPPLEVQRQISGIIEKADILRSQSLVFEQELKLLSSSLFFKMFGNPVRNEKKWKKCKLRELVADLQGGKSIAASEDEENSGKNRVLKVSAVTWGEFKPTESKPLPNSYEPPQEHFVKPNDLLFSRANTTELVGATSLVFDTPSNVLLPDKLWRFIWNEESAQSQVFMWQLLSNQSVRRELGKISTGSGGSMKNISKAKLYDFEIVFPDISLQLEFESKFIKIRNLILSNVERNNQLSQNFNSLLQRAFKGQLELKGLG